MTPDEQPRLPDPEPEPRHDGLCEREQGLPGCACELRDRRRRPMTGGRARKDLFA